jgi:hypothetical protein
MSGLCSRVEPTAIQRIKKAPVHILPERIFAVLCRAQRECRQIRNSRRVRKAPGSTQKLRPWVGYRLGLITETRRLSSRTDQNETAPI